MNSKAKQEVTKNSIKYPKDAFVNYFFGKLAVIMKEKIEEDLQKNEITN